MRLYDGPLGIGYFIYATKRWGIDEGLSRWLTYELGPRLRFKRTRRAAKVCGIERNDLGSHSR
jgi:hypothetical protein